MNKKLTLVLLVATAFGQAYAMMDGSMRKPLSAMRSERRPAIDRLLEMTFDKDMILESMRANLNALKNRSLAVEQDQNSPEMDALVSKFQNKIAQELFSESTIRKIKELYTKVYTEQELEELVKFYESPIGQKTLKNLPEVSVQVTSIMAETMQKHFTEYVTQVSQLTQKAQECSATR